MVHSVCWCCIFWRKMPKPRYWVIFIASSIPGAPLLLADLMAPTDPLERKAMGLQSRPRRFAASCLRADGAPPREDFTSLDEGQTRRLLQAGFAAAHRFFQALGFHGWLAQRQ